MWVINLIQNSFRLVRLKHFVWSVVRQVVTFDASQSFWFSRFRPFGGDFSRIVVLYINFGLWPTSVGRTHFCSPQFFCYDCILLIVFFPNENGDSVNCPINRKILVGPPTAEMPPNRHPIIVVIKISNDANDIVLVGHHQGTMAVNHLEGLTVQSCRLSTNVVNLLFTVRHDC